MTWKKWSEEKPTSDIEWIIIKVCEATNMVFDRISHDIGIALVFVNHHDGEIDICGTDGAHIYEDCIDAWMPVDIRKDDIVKDGDTGPSLWFPSYHGDSEACCPWCGEFQHNLYFDKESTENCDDCNNPFSIFSETRYFSERVES